MARPIKQGLDYFPLDVDCDDKVELIEARYGMLGFGILIKLWQKIYKEGYFIEWNEEKLLLFKKQINVDENLINDIINDCLNWKIFHLNIYEKYKILTSRGIQKRYIIAVGRRTKINVFKEYCLLDSINDNINLINVNIIGVIENNMNTETEIMYTKSTQRKEKKRKEKKSKVNKSTFVVPTLQEIEIYCTERKNNVDAKKFYDYFTVSNWIDSKGNEVKNWKQKIITWENQTENITKKQETHEQFDKELEEIFKDAT